jgi:nucleotide-binding universal stress UspA family protein
MSRGTVLVGVDGSEASLRAVDWAAAEAVARAAELVLRVVVYAAPADAVLWTGADLAPLLADDVIARATERARRTAGVSVRSRVGVGWPTAELVGPSRQADLLVVGSRGLGAFTGLLLGSVSQHVAEHAACPVVVVRGESTYPQLPVLLGVDGSAANLPAVEFAFAAADRRKVGLVALSAATPPWIAPPIGSPMAPVPDRAELGQSVQAVLDRAVHPWVEKYPGVIVQYLPVLGPAARALIEATADASLVVVGSRGHGELAGLLLGSVSGHLLRHADCPVAVVRS